MGQMEDFVAQVVEYPVEAVELAMAAEAANLVTVVGREHDHRQIADFGKQTWPFGRKMHSM